MKNKTKFLEYLSVIKSPFPPDDLQALWVTDFSNEESRIYSYGPNGWLPAGDASEGTSKIVTVDTPSLILSGNGTPANPLSGIVPVVTHTSNGLMLAKDKAKLDDLTSYIKSIIVVPRTNRVDIRYTQENADTGVQTLLDRPIPAVTNTLAGVMLPEDKVKLDYLITSPFRGEFTSVEELTAGVTDPRPGDYGYVDQGVGSDVVKYLWDSSDNLWVLLQGASTGETPESIKEKYESVANAFTDVDKAKVENTTRFVDTISYEYERSATTQRIPYNLFYPEDASESEEYIDILPVDDNNAGLMLPTDKVKLNTITNVNYRFSQPVYSATDARIAIVSDNLENGIIDPVNIYITQATQQTAGLISAADKTKLDSLPSGGGTGGLTEKVELDLSNYLNGTSNTFPVPNDMIFPELFYNGLRQTLNKHYTVTGTTLTINFAAPSSGEELLITYFK